MHSSAMSRLSYNSDVEFKEHKAKEQIVHILRKMNRTKSKTELEKYEKQLRFWSKRLDNLHE